MRKIIPKPGCVRKVAKGFGWLDHRLLREGWLKKMTIQEVAVYVFLVLAADRNGVSFYRNEKIAFSLGIEISDVLKARKRLIEQGLIAFKAFSRFNPNGFWQVLDVPYDSEKRPSGYPGIDAGPGRKTATPQLLGEVIKTVYKEASR